MGHVSMNQAVTAALTALVVTLCCLPVVRSVLVRRSVLDHPDHRSSHTVPIPRGGGLAVLVGVGAGWAVTLLNHQALHPVVLACGLTLGTVGLIDDLHGLGVASRIAAQAVVGAMVGAALDPLPWSGPALGALVGAAVVVGGVNVVNFLDGINGITALTTIAWGVVMLAAGVTYDVPALVPLGGVLAGAALGFLPFNAPRATIFLGDVGSYGIGAMAAAAGLLALARGVPFVVVFAPTTPYLADALCTLVRRAVARQPLTAAHREHLYQHLTRPGRLPHVPVAATYGGAALLLGVVALAAPHVVAWSLVLATAVVVVAAAPAAARTSASPPTAATP